MKFLLTSFILLFSLFAYSQRPARTITLNIPFRSSPLSTMPISGLAAATGTNTINSLNYLQEWQWNTLAAGTGLKLSSTSTASIGGTQTVFSVLNSGANGTGGQTTYGAMISNTKTGGTSTNIGLDLNASGGTNNVALNISGGYQQITSSATGQKLLLFDQGGATLRNGFGIATNGDVQTFIRNTAGVAFTVNNGGDLQTSGTNELMRIASGGASFKVAGTFTIAGGTSTGQLRTNTATAGEAKIVLFDQGSGLANGFGVGSDGGQQSFIRNLPTQMWWTWNAGPGFATGTSSSVQGTGEIMRLNAAGLSVNGLQTASAILSANSTTQGFLPPRMTTVQRDAILSAATGLRIFNSSTNTIDFKAASAWTQVVDALNTQTIGGAKTFSSSVTLANAAQLLMGQPSAGNAQIARFGTDASGLNPFLMGIHNNTTNRQWNFIIPNDVVSASTAFRFCQAASYSHLNPALFEIAGTGIASYGMQPTAVLKWNGGVTNLARITLGDDGAGTNPIQIGVHNNSTFRNMVFHIPADGATNTSSFNFNASSTYGYATGNLFSIGRTGLSSSVPWLGTFAWTTGNVNTDRIQFANGTGSNPIGIGAHNNSTFRQMVFYTPTDGTASQSEFAFLEGGMALPGTSATLFSIRRDKVYSSKPFEAQSTVVVGGTTLTAGAVFDAQSTTQGSYPFPRMTSAQRLLISVTAANKGMHVYQTDGAEGVYVYKTAGWTFAY